MMGRTVNKVLTQRAMDQSPILTGGKRNLNRESRGSENRQLKKKNKTIHQLPQVSVIPGSGYNFQSQLNLKHPIHTSSFLHQKKGVNQSVEAANQRPQFKQNVISSSISPIGTNLRPGSRNTSNIVSQTIPMKNMAQSKNSNRSKRKLIPHTLQDSDQNNKRATPVLQLKSHQQSDVLPMPKNTGGLKKRLVITNKDIVSTSTGNMTIKNIF